MNPAYPEIHYEHKLDIAELFLDVTSAALDEEALLSSLTRIISTLMPDLRVVINMIDADNEELHGHAESRGEAVIGRRLKLDDVLPAHREIVSRRQTILYDYESPGTDPELRDFMGRFGGRLVLYLPMIVGVRVIGDIAVDLPGERYEFSLREMRFLQTLASFAAIGLENARLFSENLEVRRLSLALNDIHLAINSSLDFDQIMRDVMLAAMAALRAESVLLATGLGNECRFRYAYGRAEDTPVGERLTPDNAPLAAAVIKAGKTMAVPDTFSNGSFDPEVWKRLGIRSSLSTPLFVKDKRFGVVAFRYHSSTADFSEAHIDFVEKVAVTVSLAIEGSQLYRSEQAIRVKAQNYATQLSLLHRISLSLGCQRDTATLLNNVLEGAAKLTRAESGAILLTGKGREEWVSNYYVPWNDQRFTIIDGARGIEQAVGRVFPRGVDAARINSGVPGLPMIIPPDHPLMNSCLIGVIRDPDRIPLGYLILGKKAGGIEFTDDDKEILSLLAAQSSVALAAVQSYQSQYRIAETLQAALLPSVPAREDLDIGLIYQSADVHGKIGGDFYDFIELQGGRIAIAVGDVCGKGIEAATHTAMIKYMLGAFLSDGNDPDECLTKLNRAICRQVAFEQFVTLCLVVLDPGSNLVSYCLAGHPPPVVFGGGRVDLMQAAAALPLGVLSDSVYTCSQTRPGPCTILLYTDGLVEARPAGGKPLSQRTLLDMLSSCDGLRPQKVVERLFDTAYEYSGGNIRDDIAIVAVENARRGIESITPLSRTVDT